MSKNSFQTLDENKISVAYLHSCDITLNIDIIDDIKQLICKYSVILPIPFDTINSVGLQSKKEKKPYTLKNDNRYIIHSGSANVCGLYLDPLYVNSQIGYYTKGDDKHCWRVCYRDMSKVCNDINAGAWFLMGLTIYGHILPQNCHNDRTVWGLTGQNNYYHFDGKTDTSNGTVSKILEYKNSQSNIGQCDMLIDFNNGTMEYKSVKDDKRIKYNKDKMTHDSVVIKQFNINSKWIPVFACHYTNDEIQIAKIPINFFGIGGNLVKFDIIQEWETNHKYKSCNK